MNIAVRKTLEVLLIALVAIFFVHLYAQAVSWTGSDIELRGHAWSDTVGWISFNCVDGGPTNDDICATKSNYKVTMNSVDGSLDGYAWSDNIGWIDFGGLSLGATQSAGGQARLNADGTALEGWARALAHGDGWDGWISFNCKNTSCVSPSFAYAATIGTGSVDGYAWGSDVVGWVSMSGPGYGVDFTPPFTPGPYACNHDPEESLVYDDQFGNTSTVVCEVGVEVCSDTTFQCETPPDPTLVDFSVNSPLVRNGDAVTITWQANGAQNCTITSTNGDNYTGGASDTYESNPLQTQTEYELACDPGTGVSTTLGTLTVKVVSSTSEI